LAVALTAGRATFFGAALTATLAATLAAGLATGFAVAALSGLLLGDVAMEFSP
jgi:predicted membrane-bound spermidine synthase